MNRRIISALIVFLLLASVAMPAVNAAETNVIENKVDEVLEQTKLVDVPSNDTDEQE